MSSPALRVDLLGLNFPPERTGIAPYTGALAAGLNELGHRVAVNVAHPHYPEWTIGEGYGQWTRVECLGGVQVVRRLHYVPRSPRGFRRLLSELSFGVRLFFAGWGGADVVIAVSPSLFSTAVAMLRTLLTPKPIPFVIWVQDIYTLGLTETGEAGRFVQRLTRWVESRTLRAAKRVVVIHERFGKFVTDELGVEASRVTVVRNWTHLRPSEPTVTSAARRKLGWPTELTLAVHTGNMGAKQGLENVVDAARLAEAAASRVHFILVGDGGERRKLEERAAGASQITFVNPLSDEEYRLALCAADVLVVNEKPGVSAMAVPSKLTSYFDSARPIVAATDLGGITASEIAAAGAGVIVPAGDPAALLHAVLTVTADAVAAEELGLRGRRYREAVLDERAAIERWAALIREIVSDEY